MSILFKVHCIHSMCITLQFLVISCREKGILSFLCKQAVNTSFNNYLWQMLSNYFLDRIYFYCSLLFLLAELFFCLDSSSLLGSFAVACIAIALTFTGTGLQLMLWDTCLSLNLLADLLIFCTLLFSVINFLIAPDAILAASSLALNLSPIVWQV